MSDYKHWENLVGLNCAAGSNWFKFSWRVSRVIDPKQEPKAEKDCELNKHDYAAPNEGSAGITSRSGCQIPLNEHLVGAMSARGQENATDEPRPKGVTTSYVDIEIEDPQLFA